MGTNPKSLSHLFVDNNQLTGAFPWLSFFAANNNNDSGNDAPSRPNRLKEVTMTNNFLTGSFLPLLSASHCRRHWKRCGSITMIHREV
jgi:hypothetical protein